MTDLNETVVLTIGTDGDNRVASVSVSNHAMKRMKERTGLPKKAIPRIAEKVFNDGIEISTLTGYLSQWAKMKLKGRDDSENIRYLMYGSHLYIFSDDGILITVEQIPCKERVMRMARGEKTASETDRKRKEKSDNRELRNRRARKNFLFSF